MLKMIDVVAAIIEQDGQILLAQRPPHADQPGMWEFAGGKVEPGESQPQALVRELQEEMGIIARPACYIASHQREVSGRRIHLHAPVGAALSGHAAGPLSHSAALVPSHRSAGPRSRPGRYSSAARLYRPAPHPFRPLIRPPPRHRF